MPSLANHQSDPIRIRSPNQRRPIPTLLGEQTDSRYRCPDFHRKPDAEMEKANDPENQDRV